MVKSIQEILAFQLRHLRKGLSWTQERLAEEAGVSVMTVQSLESCRTWVGIDTVSALAKALRVPEGRLFADPDGIPQPTPKEALEVLQEALGLAGQLPAMKRRLNAEEKARPDLRALPEWKERVMSLIEELNDKQKNIVEDFFKRLIAKNESKANKQDAG